MGSELGNPVFKGTEELYVDSERSRDDLPRRRPRSGNLFRRSFRDHSAAFIARARPQVDDPVGRDHDFRAVLDDDHRMTAVHQRVEYIKQFQDIERMQAGGRLVDQKETCAATGPHAQAKRSTWPESPRA